MGQQLLQALQQIVDRSQERELQMQNNFNSILQQQQQNYERLLLQQSTNQAQVSPPIVTIPTTNFASLLRKPETYSGVRNARVFTQWKQSITDFIISNPSCYGTTKYCLYTILSIRIRSDIRQIHALRQSRLFSYCR